MKAAVLLDGRQITKPRQSVSICVSVEVVESTPKVDCGVYRICGSLVWVTVMSTVTGLYLVLLKLSLRWRPDMSNRCQLDVPASTWLSEAVGIVVEGVFEERWWCNQWVSCGGRMGWSPGQRPEELHRGYSQERLTFHNILAYPVSPSSLRAGRRASCDQWSLCQWRPVVVLSLMYL